jgi:hypothetical protein
VVALAFRSLPFVATHRLTLSPEVAPEATTTESLLMMVMSEWDEESGVDWRATMMTTEVEWRLQSVTAWQSRDITTPYHMLISTS